MSENIFYSLEPIGVLHTPLKEMNTIPIQSARSKYPGTAEVFNQYQEGLDGIEEFSHIYLIYRFNLVDAEVNLKVTPFLDDHAHGIFSTRYPVRPNALGLSVVHLANREGCLLNFIGADMLDGTLLLDIKPYITDFDVFQVEKSGWFQKRSKP